MVIIKSDFIKEKLTWLHSKVSIDSKKGLYDINKTCEDVFMHLLNSTYGWSLQNANLIQENFPAIDLIDEHNEIVIQVTSTISTNKLTTTIDKFKKLTDYQHYRLKVFYIKDKPNFQQKTLERFAQEGVTKADLLSAQDILEIVQSDATICDSVYKTLEKITGDKSHNMEKTAIDTRDVTGVVNANGSDIKIDNRKTINNYVGSKENADQEKTDEHTEIQQLNAVKNALKNIEIKLFKKIAYQYLPRSYFSLLPNTSNEIIDHLLSIGALKNCVPILSILENIEKNRPHTDIKAFIDYLKDSKYKDKKCSCAKNKEASELSLLIYFSAQDGKSEFTIETWRYENGETYHVSLAEHLSSIDLSDNKQLASFLDVVDAYLKEVDLLIDSNKVYIEIIMPNQTIYNTIKQWKNSKGKRLIRKYKYLFRMQSRFKSPDNTWKNKWETLNITENNDTLNNDKQSLLIAEKNYDEHIVAENYSVILEKRINNPCDLFEDIEDFGIPIVLSSLSEECNIEALKKYAFKECQQTICSHIMRHHKTYKSDIFFMVDDPNKIPEEFKNPEPNLYGW